MKRNAILSLVTIIFMLCSLSPTDLAKASGESVSVLAVPVDGNWTGTIDRGNAMSFTTSSSGTQWSSFQISYSFTGSGCGNPYTSFTTGVNGPGSISNGQFSWSGTTDAYTGQFNSPNTATGTYSFTNKSFMVLIGVTPCYYYLTASGTWSANVALPMPGAFSKLSPGNTAGSQPTNPTLSWGASANATSYEYCYGTTNPCSNWTDNGTATSAALTGLTPGATYYWQVRARNSTGTTLADGGTWWSFSVIQVQTSPVFLPLVLRAVQLPGSFGKAAPANSAIGQSTGPTLSWSSSSAATSYEYCLDTVNDNLCNTAWTPTVASTSIGLSGLSLSTSYFWQVRANNTAGTTYADGGTWWSFTTTATWAPTPGYWKTTIGDDFYVTPDQANVTYFRIYFSAASCSGWVRRNTATPIVNNQFSFTGSNYASGTFDSPTSAHGTDGLNNYYSLGCGYLTVGPNHWTATWQNSSQPTSASVDSGSTDSIILLPSPGPN